MNIFLIPHTWARHLAVGLIVGGAAILNWWLFLHWIVWAGPALQAWRLLPSSGAEGAWFLSSTAAAIAGASVLTEHSLQRSPVWRRLALPAGAAAIAFVLAMMGYWSAQLITRYLLAGAEMRPLVADPSLATLRYRFLSWLAAGAASGLGPVIVRRFRGFFMHFFGGLTSAGLGAAVWQWLGYQVLGDLYLAAALGVFTWGAVHGLLVWSVPSSLYAGWVRVLSHNRYAWRVPIDRVDGAPSERFVGHFPRGLDVFLAVDDGVAELHTSFVVDGDQRYAVRGLSQQPTAVRRFLEQVDLRYDPRRPAPLETALHMEDRIVMGEGQHSAEVEFLLLPKEEA